VRGFSSRPGSRGTLPRSICCKIVPAFGGVWPRASVQGMATSGGNRHIVGHSLGHGTATRQDCRDAPDHCCMLGDPMKYAS